MKHRGSIRFVSSQLALLAAICSPTANFAQSSTEPVPGEAAASISRAAAPGPDAEPYRAITVRAANVTDAIVVDDPLCNGNPYIPVVVTPRLSPTPGAPEVFVPEQVGARYDTPSGKWTIVAQNHAAIPAGAEFNVTISDGTVVHAASAPANGVLAVDDPILDANPNARLQVSHVISSAVAPEVYVDHPVAVHYDGTKWNIYHADFTSVAANECYAVVNDGVLCAVTPPENDEEFVTIDDPLTNGKPDVVLTVTGNASSPCADVEADPYTIGVRYDGSKWQIFNENHLPIAFGGFSVSVHVRPEIASAAFNARGRLVVRGARVDAGAIVVVDGVDQVTTVRKPSGAAPRRLVVKTLSGSIPPGALSVQIRNADGSLSDTVQVDR